MPYALLSCSFVTELYFLHCIVIVSLNEINGDGDGEARPIHGLLTRQNTDKNSHYCNCSCGNRYQPVVAVQRLV